jgi:HprK-related kinase A
MPSQPSPLAHLATSGVQVSLGPFLVRVRSDLTGVHDYLSLLYSDFPLALGDGGHFDIAVVTSRGLRRWIRPQANLVVNGERPFLPLPGNLAGAMFEWSLNWCVGNQAHRWVAVHAAVLERNGQTFILSGESGAGKSTLCAALALKGWRLFSDEFALIDPDSGRLTPLPRPISLKNASIEIIRRRAPHAVFGPEDVDIEGARFVHMKPPSESVRRAREEASPGWVVLPRWTAGRPTALEPLPKAQALLRMTDQSFNYNYLGAKGYECVEELVRRSDCYTLEYSDLDDVLARLESVAASKGP